MQALGELLSNPDGDASPFIPMLQQQTPQLGDFRRVHPSCDAAAAAAGTAGSGGSISGLAGRQQSSLLGDEQARGFLWRAGNRALLGVLASIFRDVQVRSGFMQGGRASLLSAMLACCRPCGYVTFTWVFKCCSPAVGHTKVLAFTARTLFTYVHDNLCCCLMLPGVLRSLRLGCCWRQQSARAPASAGWQRCSRETCSACCRAAGSSCMSCSPAPLSNCLW